MSNGSNVVRARGPQPVAAPQSGQPVQQDGWNWTGAGWVCDGGGPFGLDPHSAPWYPGANAGVSFGPPGNFPQYAIRGNFFWDGVTLWMFDGAAWVKVGGASAGGLVGVTDGSNAAPGMVGEFLSNTQTVTISTTGVVTTPVSTLVLPPGDWDVYAWALPSTFVLVCNFVLNPQPAGLSNQMIGNFWAGGAPAEGVLALSTMARASLTQPTLLAYSLTTDATTTMTVVFQVEARRRR